MDHNEQTTEPNADGPGAQAARARTPRTECWIYLSERLPAPLSGKYRVTAAAPDVVDMLATARSSDTLAPVHVMLDLGREADVWINPAHVVAVMPMKGP